VNKESFSPRLHAILARDENIGIVIRRGPSKQVLTFLWNLDNDTFKIGQWLKGRIYERRCDLSRDGKFFLYFAMAEKWNQKTTPTWTALSRAPYLKALDFYPKGDAWEGGGLFLNDRKYFLNDRYYLKHEAERRMSGLECVTNVRAEHAHGAECLSIYFPRLLRDGWKLISNGKNLAVFEKSSKDWTLRKLAHAGVNTPDGKGCYWDEHKLSYKKDIVITGSDWEWAEIHGKTIIFAKNGRMFRAKLSASGDMMNPKILEDFSEYSFTPIRAPY